MLIGDNFTIKTSDYEEDNTLKLSPKDMVLLHFLEKGRDVAKSLPEGVVISADTVVIVGGEVFGKPADHEGAKEMLAKMSGKVIDVISGLAVIDVETKKELRDFEITKVKFKEMTQQEIDDYVATDEPLGKAGSFGIQGKAATLIEKIDGDYSNILGLPLFKLNNLLSQLGISIFDF